MLETTTTAAGPEPADATPEGAAAPRKVSPRKALLLGGGILAAILVTGTLTRIDSRHALHAATLEAMVPSAKVIHPKPVTAGAVVLPGRLEAWSEAPVYARTNGYLRRWSSDIGDHVKAGQVLAEIDTPEVDQQLAAAHAALATAEANRALAETTAKRWDRLLSSHAVSQQEVDERHGDLAARQAMENEARANVSRLQALTDFKRIVAPFDGVVTSRATDIGALIVAGDARATPLFSVSDTSRLRLYVNVPQNYGAAAAFGATAHFTVPDHPDEHYAAKVVRSASAVDSQSGTMLVQLEFDNRAGILRPGAYAQVSLDAAADRRTTQVRIPASALLFRKEGTAVAVAGPDGEVTVKPVRIAQDFGAELAIGSGLDISDLVIDSPSDAIGTGDKVRIADDQGAPKNAHP